MSTKKRLARGEAKQIIEQWCNDYVQDQGTKPTYTVALKGCGVAAMTFAKPWAAWNAEFDAKQSSSLAALATPPAPITVPSAIVDAWTAAVEALDAAKLRELEADKVLVRRELNQVITEKDALATEVAAILADGEEVQEEFDRERAETTAALASARAVISERDAALTEKEAVLVQTQNALMAQGAELELAKISIEKLENAFNKAVSDERAAHLKCEQSLGELAESHISITRLQDELTTARSALTAAEAALSAKDKKLESLQEKVDVVKQNLSERSADLTGASATVTALREQLAAAEVRAEQSRQRSDAELDTAHKRIVELERELAGLKSVMSA